MATYAIGDVQGCFNELQSLLTLIQFDPKTDRLWFTGDLVNRGSHSLETIRFVKSLGNRAITILGNHDLHLLAVKYQARELKNKDTFQDILDAPDCNELCDWLRYQPMMHYDAKLNYAMVHAGLAPEWDLKQALNYAHEIENFLRSENINTLLENMYGNQPNIWDPHLSGWPRLRVLINYFTRVRYIDHAGHLDLDCKGPLGQQPKGFYPWFAVPNRKLSQTPIIFGHWASLQGAANTHNIFALDTGCCWGYALTAMRLEDQRCFQVSCQHLGREGILE